MKRFLDVVNSKWNLLLTYLEILYENYTKVLLILGTVSYFLNDFYITIFCVILYGIIIISKRNSAYIVAKRISAYDSTTPKILQDLIDECIKENYLYRYAGNKDPFISSDKEIEMNHDVLDLIILRLDNSVLMDKFRLHYGDEFEEILSTQVNMSITVFVLEKNAPKPNAHKAKPGSTGLRSSEVSTEDMLKNLGITVVK